MIRLWDINAAVGPWLAADLGATDMADLVSECGRIGVERAVVYHTVARMYDPVIGNVQLDALLDGRPEFRACWVLVPEMAGRNGADRALHQAMVEHRVAAARCFPRDHNFRLTGPESRNLLRVIAELGIPLLLEWEQTDAAEVEGVCRAFPTIPVVLCRIGYRSLRQVTGLFDVAPNCKVDLSYFATHEGLEYLVDLYGPQRVLFGTGRPFTDPGGAITRLMYSSLGERDLNAISWENLASLVPGWEVPER